jgi:kinesin family protein 20
MFFLQTFAVRKLIFLFVAKKIIETMSSSKLTNVEASKENVSQPKRAKRKLYTNEISSPIDISGQVVS